MFVGSYETESVYCEYLLQAGAGTMRPDIMSSEMTGGSLGGGGHTRESIISSVAARITPVSSGGSVRDDLCAIIYSKKKSKIHIRTMSRNHLTSYL